MEALVLSKDSCMTIGILRKVLENLLVYIDKDIKKYKTLELKIDKFQNGNIDEITKKSLHLIRSLGNEVLHSNEIDNIKIDFRVVRFLFDIINDIVKIFITNKREIEEIYSLLPESAKRENRKN